MSRERGALARKPFPPVIEWQKFFETSAPPPDSLPRLPLDSLRLFCSSILLPYRYSSKSLSFRLQYGKKPAEFKAAFSSFGLDCRISRVALFWRRIQVQQGTHEVVSQMWHQPDGSKSSRNHFCRLLYLLRAT